LAQVIEDFEPPPANAERIDVAALHVHIRCGRMAAFPERRSGQEDAAHENRFQGTLEQVSGVHLLGDIARGARVDAGEN